MPNEYEMAFQVVFPIALLSQSVHEGSVMNKIEKYHKNVLLWCRQKVLLYGLQPRLYYFHYSRICRTLQTDNQTYLDLKQFAGITFLDDCYEAEHQQTVETTI